MTPAPRLGQMTEILDQVFQALWNERSSSGHWEGELSSSALSTATAVTALAIVQRERRGKDQPELGPLMSAGLRWLARHANRDGGWGDTVLSLSNLSTTTLAWAAWGAVPPFYHPPDSPRLMTSAEAWITRQTGGLEPRSLASALAGRYGQDRTFSAPILTLCALSGRLGTGDEAWRHVLALPFELAAFPPSWFAALRLPVVSYALPALIAIGQARHAHRPSRNPMLRLARHLARDFTLKRLEQIQPANGGFLEATPLTSFVVMSLAGSGVTDHPVVQRGLDFLVKSARPDGSWPIDTNLATWLTTLAVNALKPVPRSAWPAGAIKEIRSWLLSQQFRHLHPYTQAAPGGWAWTDLPGGVPDADDTAGALLALHALDPPDPALLQAVHGGITWLLDLQNRDGGLPTFCRGWGALPFDRSSPDLTAHAIRAWTTWRNSLQSPLANRIDTALPRAWRFLVEWQRPDGSWLPLWFGNQHAPDETNPIYGTSRVLLAGAAAPPRAHPQVVNALRRGLDWLLKAQHPEGGWGGGPGLPVSIEETALAVEALAAGLADVPAAPWTESRHLSAALDRGVSWLINRVSSGAWRERAPIGFYFARLWYFEKLYPIIFTTAALAKASQIPKK